MSIYSTHDLVVSLPKIVGIVFGLGVFYSVSRESRIPIRWWVGVGLFFGLGTIIAVVGFLGLSSPGKIGIIPNFSHVLPQWFVNNSIVQGGFNPNEIAGVLLWILPGFFSLSIFSWRSTRSLINSYDAVYAAIFLLVINFLSFFIFIVLLLSQSRTAYIAFFITFPAILWFGMEKIAYKIFSVIVIILLVGIAVIIIWGGGLLNSEIIQSINFEIAEIIELRFEIWERAIYSIEDFPITGMGMNSFRELINPLYPLSLLDSSRDIGHAHNEFFQAAIDLGIPGLFAFILIHIATFYMLYKLWKWRNLISRILHPNYLDHNLSIAIILGLGGGFFAHMLFGLVDGVSLGAKPGFMWWILIGLISGLYAQLQNSLSEGNRTIE